MEEDIGPEYSNLAPGMSWGSSDLRPRALRNLLGAYPTGVAVVTTRTAGGRQVGLTINSFASLSLEPPLVLWSLGNGSTNLDAFSTCPYFAINILSSRQEDVARRFANSRLANKFADVALRETPEGLPIIHEALSVLVCANDHSRMVGDHLLLVGRVVRTNHHPGEPLVFHGGRFLELPGAGHGPTVSLASAQRHKPDKTHSADSGRQIAAAAMAALLESGTDW